MRELSFIHDRVRIFSNVVVHPTQELPHPTLFRGGPDWPRFEAQLLVRQCWGRFPKPIDFRPHPVEPEWPYFAKERYLNPQYRPRRRWSPFAERSLSPPGAAVETADKGIWCGAVYEHFGVMIAEYCMRLVASSLIDPKTPLVFSIFPMPDYVPEPFFWRIVDHFGIDRGRILLVRKPTRFARLMVLPQAERPEGGSPSRRHLRLMDALTASLPAAERDRPTVFVSRSRLGRGKFAAEPYLDDVMAAAGMTVFHPQTEDLAAQLALYRSAPRLIFSEGSALHALQLLGHIDADLVILTRRPGNRLAMSSLRPRTRSLHYVDAVQGVVHGLTPAGDESPAKGISVLDETRLIAGLRAIGIDIAPFWESQVHAARRDADVAAWIGERLAAPTHPEEADMIERSLAALSLQHLHE